VLLVDAAEEVWGPFDCSNNKRNKYVQV